MTDHLEDDLCSPCGHERGWHQPTCEIGLWTNRPCGCQEFLSGPVRQPQGLAPVDTRRVVTLRRRTFGEAVRHIVGLPPGASDDDVTAELSLWKLERER